MLNRRIAVAGPAIGVLAGLLIGPLAGLPAQHQGSSRGQGPECHPVPGATTTVFTVAFHHGFDDDAAAECGAARVLAQCRLERGRAALAGHKASRRQASGLHLGSDLAVLFVQVDAEQWQRGAAFVRAVLGDGTPLEDDAIQLAIAGAALVADDAEWLYPGPVLQSKARLALFSDCRGRAVQGSATAVQQLDPVGVRAQLRRPVAVEIAAFGAVCDELRQLEFAIPAAPAAAPAVAASARTGAGAGRAPELVTHSRVDAPFAAVAFAAPPAERWPAFAVAVEVARMRSVRRFPRVVEQSMARAPAVSWSWLDGDPVTVFCRRGRPGDGVEVAFAELDRFLADLRDRPPEPGELEIARRSLVGELSPLPWNDELVAALRRSPAAMSGRALAAVQSRHRGITAAGIAGVTAVVAHEVLRATIDPGLAWRGGLLPVARPEPAWRR